MCWTKTLNNLASMMIWWHLLRKTLHLFLLLDESRTRLGFCTKNLGLIIQYEQLMRSWQRFWTFRLPILWIIYHFGTTLNVHRHARARGLGSLWEEGFSISQTGLLDFNPLYFSTDNTPKTIHFHLLTKNANEVRCRSFKNDMEKLSRNVNHYIEIIT